MKVKLAVSITVWTLIAWGGRISLLTSGEGWGAWLRIGGSIVIGLFAAATLVIVRLEPARRPALILFSLFNVVLWSRSLIVAWSGSGSLPFKAVHTVLAAGFFVLAYLSWRVARDSGRPVPVGETTSAADVPGSDGSR